MICPNQSNRGPLEKKKEKELKCGPLPPADPSGAVEKQTHCSHTIRTTSAVWNLLWKGASPKRAIKFHFFVVSVMYWPRNHLLIKGNIYHKHDISLKGSFYHRFGHCFLLLKILHHKQRGTFYPLTLLCHQPHFSFSSASVYHLIRELVVGSLSFAELGTAQPQLVDIPNWLFLNVMSLTFEGNVGNTWQVSYFSLNLQFLFS